jgi:hypothetical protein
LCKSVKIHGKISTLTLKNTILWTFLKTHQPRPYLGSHPLFTLLHYFLIYTNK